MAYVERSFVSAPLTSGLITQPYHPSAVLRLSITFHSSATVLATSSNHWVVRRDKKENGTRPEGAEKTGAQGGRDKSGPLRKTACSRGANVGDQVPLLHLDTGEINFFRWTAHSGWIFMAVFLVFKSWLGKMSFIAEKYYL